jgi:DNA-binding NarL/FixJ family response regulator
MIQDAIAEGRRGTPTAATPRQQAVLRLLCCGLSNKEIAARLGRSAKTVEHHITALLQRSGASSRLELVVSIANGDAVGNPSHDAAQEAPERLPAKRHEGFPP